MNEMERSVPAVAGSESRVGNRHDSGVWADALDISDGRQIGEVKSRPGDIRGCPCHAPGIHAAYSFDE